MRKQYLFFLLVLVGILLAFSACDKDSDEKLTDIPEVTPDKYDWYISLADMSYRSDAVYYDLFCDWLGGEPDFDPEDIFTAKFGNLPPVELDFFFGGGMYYLSGRVELEPGKNYKLKLMRNGNEIFNIDAMPTFAATVDFPELYNPAFATQINWSLAANNQNQILVVGISDYEDDDYRVSLSPSVRKHTIPANPLGANIESEEYVIGITQYNFSSKGRIALLAYDMAYKDYYGDDVPAKNTVQARRAMFRKLGF